MSPRFATGLSCSVALHAERVDGNSSSPKTSSSGQKSRSMRSAWIEIIMALTLRLARWSRSMRSAWIEMPGPVYIGAASVVALHAERVDGNGFTRQALINDDRRAPCGARGLKFLARGGVVDEPDVALHAERVDGNADRKLWPDGSPGRAPCGARGLKGGAALPLGAAGDVALHAERVDGNIVISTHLLLEKKVALHAERVDGNLFAKAAERASGVALHAERVDGNGGDFLRRDHRRVALHAERVDGNTALSSVGVDTLLVALHAERVDGNRLPRKRQYRAKGRAPCGARGLKSVLASGTTILPASRSMRSAWIEIDSARNISAVNLVALHAERVDGNRQGFIGGPLLHQVALHAERVDGNWLCGIILDLFDKKKNWAEETLPQPT